MLHNHVTGSKAATVTILVSYRRYQYRTLPTDTRGPVPSRVHRIDNGTGYRTGKLRTIKNSLTVTYLRVHTIRYDYRTSYLRGGTVQYRTAHCCTRYGTIPYLHTGTSIASYPILVPIFFFLPITQLLTLNEN